MTSKGIAIKYGDVAPEAKENFVPSSSASKFDTIQQLQRYNVQFPNYGNPCEVYSVPLDGSALLFPAVPTSANIGLVSADLSGDDGYFATPIVLTLTSVGQYSSQGLTLTFDTQNGIYATDLTIQWFRDTELLSSASFEPAEATFFCRNRVDNYNKVIITMRSINMPKNRLKLRVIDYGYGTYFTGSQLRNVKLIQELNPLSTEIAINPADFTLDSNTDMEYSFQTKQPLEIYFNGTLRATTFVKTSKRKAKRLWEIQSEDYIGLMDGIPFAGGIYTDALASDLLTDIFAVAKIPYEISSASASKRLSGHIPYTTCREALMQVAFAIQAVVDTSNAAVVRIFDLGDVVTQTIPLDRIMQGQTFEDEDTVTGVEVVAHNYVAKSETITAYEAKESGVGDNILVKFSEPLHSLSITDGAIIESGANYAIINASENAVLKGKKYDHTTQTKRKNNPVVLASEIEKIVAVQNATLVSSSNVDAVLDRCYDWLTRTSSVNLKIVEGKHIVEGEPVLYGAMKYGEFKYGEFATSVIYDQAVNVGDVIKADTEYLGTVQGRITKQTFNLNGNIIIKEAEMR
jgi:hypothetical protein